MKMLRWMVLAGCASTTVVAAAMQIAGISLLHPTGSLSGGIQIVSAPMRYLANAMGFGTSGTTSAAGPALTAGGATLSFPSAGDSAGGFGVRISGTGLAPVVSSAPVQVFVCTDSDCPANGSGNRATSQTPIDRTSYSSISAPDQNGVILARATVISPGGTQFQVEDRYSVAGANLSGAFKLLRRVTAVARQGTDRGFTSQFRMAFDTTASGDYHIFSPAVWYDRNNDVAADWFGGVKQKPSIYWRETRAGLPLVMLQDPSTGSAFTITHIGAAPNSQVDETTSAWTVSSDIRYGALGVENAAQAAGCPTSIGFIYPANETARDTNATVSWIRRSNLITNNYYQEYSLLLALRPGATTNANRDINAAMADSWRLAYNILRPTDYRTVSAETTYQNGIGLIYDWSRTRKNGAQGVPGVVNLPAGPTEAQLAGDDWSYVMGYIGEQIPLGFQLFWRGLTSNDADMRKKGEQTLDFWANTAARSAGASGEAARTDTRLPFTWYYVPTAAYQNSTCHFPIYLRYLGDGMEAMVSAALVARRNGTPHPNWERFASGFGDWLVDHQNKTDYSWFRAYNPDGSQYTNSACEPVATAGDPRQNTTHVIRFLAQLYEATGKQSYLDAAKNAGKYAITNIYGVGRYVGGTTDTPNVLDREAGIISLRAALALYDVTRDKDWLKWARQAANYAETWTYAYNFPINAPAAAQQYGPIGMSMISTGQSGADISASLLSYDLFRMYLFDTTNDDHFRDMARLLESTSKYSTQFAGAGPQNYGYAHAGLVGEANTWFTLGGNTSGTGSAFQWLPWLTNAQLDPLQRMQERFGTMSIDVAMQQGLDALRTKNDHPLPKYFPNWGH